MPTDPEPVHGNDSSDDWGSAEERQTDPLKYDPAYLSDRYFYRVVAWSLAGLAGLALIGTISLLHTIRKFLTLSLRLDRQPLGPWLVY